MNTIARVMIAGVLALGLVGCGESDEQVQPSAAPIVQLGAPGESNRVLTPEEAAEIAAPEYTDVDVQFARDMLHHHAQALRMTGFVPDRTSNPDIQLLAERMELSQQDEITLLETWLVERGQPVVPEDDHTEHHEDADTMPGILTEAQLASLEAAGGEEFDRLFLELMLYHHAGAVQMVSDLFADGGGNEPEIGRFALHVEADQNIEIERMRSMLDGLGG